MPTPNIPGSHFKGPVLGASNTLGGLWEDFPLQTMFHQGRSYNDYFMSGDPTIAGGNWAATQLAAGGTTSILGAPDALGGATQVGGGGIQLSHGTANQGPSVRLVTNVTGPIEQALFCHADPGQDTFPFSCGIQSRLTKTAGTAAGADVFWGFGFGAAQNALLATGLIDNVNIGEAAGWINTDAAGTPSATLRPCIMDGGTLRTLTMSTAALAALPALNNNGFPGNVYGVRIDSTNSRDIVSWYVNGNRVHSQSPGATGTGRFGFTMTCHFSLVNESGAATTFQMRNFHFAEFFYQS